MAVSDLAPPSVVLETAPAPRKPFSLRPGRPVRVAVVGAGYVANFHLEILAELAQDLNQSEGLGGVETVAVCDPALDRAQAAARQWNVPNAVASVAELAGLDVDVAHVLVPPDLHVAVTRQLLEMGIGALVEKPFALASADGRELQSLADEKGLPLGVNHNNIYHPAFTRLVEHVRSGRLGRVEHVQVCLSVPLAQLEAGDYSHWMFRAPENIVFEQAPHPFSQLHALIGPVKEAHTTILGTRELHPGQIFHDRWLVAARGERGTAEVYLAFGQGFNRWTLQVLGTDGSAEADLGHNLFSFEEKTPWLEFWNTFLAGWRRSRSLAGDAVAGAARYGASTLGLTRRQDTYFVGMRRSLRAFYEALRSGRPLPTDGTQAAEVLDWCEAAAKAALAHDPAWNPSPAAIPVSSPARPGEIVVLGGTGFIGRRVVAGLLDRGLPVTTVIRRTHGLPPALLEAAGRGKLRLVRGSLEDGAALAEALQGARQVIHLATGSGDTWEKVERSMIRGSVAVAEAALAEGVERFVYVSSVAALYAGADSAVDPATGLLEDSLETDPQPDGRDVYSRGKMAAEQALLDLHRRRGLPLVIVRPGVVLGEGTPMQHSGFGLWVRDNHCVGWGLGDTPLPVVLADDVADALVRLAAHEGHDLDGRALNLCTRTPLSAREIVEELRRATGRDLHFHPRPLWLSQTMEIGKWMVKVAGRRPGATFPSYRDLKSRSLAPGFSSRTAREVLGWRPVEDRETLLDRAVRIYAPRAPQEIG